VDTPDAQARDVGDQVESTGFDLLLLSLSEHSAAAQRHKRQGELVEQRST
jgi:hypothetical protein